MTGVVSRGVSIARDALGVLLVIAGLAWLFVSWQGGPPTDVGACEGFPYLQGVWCRSPGNPLQFLLLSAALSVFPHYVWYCWVGHRGDPAEYDRFAAWGQTVLTSLGFLGTVIGVSLAVGGLRDAMLAQDPTSLIVGLSTAFDTTFLGLVGAIQYLVLRQLTSET